MPKIVNNEAQGRYDVNCRDGAGRTPLHNACVRGHVRMLISEFQAGTTLRMRL